MPRQSLVALRIGIVVSLSIGFLSGCAPASVDPVARDEPAAPQPLSVMPDVTGQSVGEVVELLSAHTGTITVTFPAVAAAMSLEERQVAGVTKPARTATIEVGERIRGLGELSPSDGHLIVEQAPAAGTPLEPGTAVRLVAGPHPGPPPQVWVLGGHTQKIREGGADSCFECHTPENCAACHTKYLE